MADDNPSLVPYDSSGQPLATPLGTSAVSAITVQGDPTGVPIPISGTITATEASVGLVGAPVPLSADQAGGIDPSGNLQPIQITASGAIKVDSSGSTQPISAVSLPLPTGASTSALQTTGNSSLSSIDSKTPALGQAAMVASSPVVIASNQSTLPAQGIGVAGTPAGGVLSIQGVAGGTPMPISGTITASDASVGLTGVAVPGSTQLNGGSDGTNIQSNRMFDLDTGVGFQWNLGVSLRLPSAGGSVAGGTATDPLRIDPTGTTTQPISAVSLPLPTGAATAANQITLGSQTTKINDGTNTAAVKAASTAPLATDPALVVAISPNSPVMVEAGNKTNNAAAPGTNNLGVLPALANAAAPSWTEGNQVVLSTNLAGSTRIDNTSWLGSTAPTVGLKTAASSIPVIIASDQTLPLPTGAATEATLLTRLTEVTFTARINTLGQKAMAASTPVVIASDQSALPVTVTLPVVATSAVTSVASSAASVTLLVSNASRRGATIYNDGNFNLFVKLGTTASLTSFTVRLGNGSYYEVPFGYTGRIDGIWSGANATAARITELT